MSNILKTGLLPISTATYKENNRIYDTNIGKFISLSGSRKFYNPGTGLILQTPNPQTTTSVVNQTINLSSFVIPNGTNSVTFQATLSDTLSFDLNIVMYANFVQTVNGQQTLVQQNGAPGTGQVYFTILKGQTVGTTSISTQIALGSSIDVFLVSLSSSVNQSNFTYNINANDTSKAVLTVQDTITSSISATFTNSLNIPELNIQSINFYGANRDTLILIGNTLTS